MKIIRSAKSFQKTLEVCRQKGKSVGFVPTMGALHEGHIALVKASKKQNDVTAVSIFVNPTQFGPNEDFHKYPRVLNQDSLLLKKAGVDYLFYPSVDEMYPPNCAFSVLPDSRAGFAQGLCAKFRPGHFEGVATVVTKLFNLSGACRAYFGAKDFQQTVVIKRLVQDLLLPVKVVVCPTIREKDGLAMSSRNRYLSPQERIQAVTISRVLFALKLSIESLATQGQRLELLKKQAVQSLEREGLKVQYFEIADSETLEKIETLRPKMIAATACYAGKTRLIDNVIIHAPQKRKISQTLKR